MVTPPGVGEGASGAVTAGALQGRCRRGEGSVRARCACTGVPGSTLGGRTGQTTEG